MTPPLTVAQVAERLGVHNRTVYRLCTAGRLPHHRIGLHAGTIRVTEAQLAGYLRSCEVIGETPHPVALPGLAPRQSAKEVLDAIEAIGVNVRAQIRARRASPS